MITNDRQYKITRLQAAKFREGLAAVPSKGLPRAALKAMREGAQSQLRELEEQIAEYETLRDGEVSSFAVDSIEGLGVALIKARIARKLTHKALAERMQMAEQQVQRDEATFYEGASIRRLQEVANALNLRIHEVVTLEKE